MEALLKPRLFHAPVAQWIEQQPSKLKVGGSIPPGRTILLRSTTENHSSSFEESVLFKVGGSMGGGPVSPKQVGFGKGRRRTKSAKILINIDFLTFLRYKKPANFTIPP